MVTSQDRGPVRWLHAVLAILPSLLFLIALGPTTTEAQLIDCYRFDGSISPNNTRCPNSNACCGPQATCLSNNLCTSHNDPNPNAKLVRGPCAVKGWDPSCAQICKYNEGKLFPRVGTCPDGSLCCDDDPDCCEKGLGIFLDESGNQVDTRPTGVTTRYPPGSGTSRPTVVPTTSGESESTSTTEDADTTKTSSASKSTTASSRGGSTTSTTTTEGETTETSPPPDGDSDPSSDSGADSDSDTASGAGSSQSSGATTNGVNDSLDLKVGLGVGIPAAVLILAGLVYCFLLRRRLVAAAAAPETAPGFQPGGPGAGTGAGTGQYQPIETQPMASYAASAVPSYPGPTPIFSPRGHFSEQQKHYNPVEIGGQTAVEMHTPYQDQGRPQHFAVQQVDPNSPGQRYELSGQSVSGNIVY